MKYRDISKLLEMTHFVTIMAFSEALEAKDQYTTGHSRRVVFKTALSDFEQNKNIQFKPYIADIFIEILTETPYYCTLFREPVYVIDKSTNSCLNPFKISFCKRLF